MFVSDTKAVIFSVWSFLKRYKKVECCYCKSYRRALCGQWPELQRNIFGRADLSSSE